MKCHLCELDVGFGDILFCLTQIVLSTRRSLGTLLHLHKDKEAYYDDEAALYEYVRG